MNGGSCYFRRDDHDEEYHFEGGIEKASIRGERELGKLQAQCRADGDTGSRIMQGSSGFPGNCSYSLECDDIPAATCSDSRLLKGHSNCSGSGVVKKGRDLGKNVEEHDIIDGGKLERDYELLANTLLWIKRMALEPGNPHMGQGPEGTSQNEEWVRECASQAVKVRALLWKRREEIRPGDAHFHQVKQILAPSLYYDFPRPEQQALERLRATRERVAHYGFPSAQKPLHEYVNLQRSSSSSLAQSQWVGQTSHRLPRQSHFFGEERFLEDPFLDRPRKRIPVGLDFQALIPVWSVDHSNSVADRGRAGPTGDETQSSDEDDEDISRWFGKLVWPPPRSKRVVYKDQVGKGRSSCCTCLDPESVDCVRLHILEERDRLKIELGQAFYIWKFDQMGESVADNWTKEEEQTFRALVKMNPPSLDKNFWDQLPETFPGKKTKELVSYYFNVFVSRRRAIQNRLDPKHVDSDDDETDLTEGDSEDSEDYESGEEIDEEGDEDASDEEDIDRHNSLYGGDSSAKLLEDTGFCDLGGVNMVYSSKLGGVNTGDESDGVRMTLCTTSQMSLQDVNQGYHDPHQERGIILHSSHMTTKWSHEQHHDDEKHLEEEHLSIVGDEELQEVKTWEASHWDEAYHEHLVHDPPGKGISCKGEQSLSAEKSPSSYKKVMNVTIQQTSLESSCEGEVWDATMDISPSQGKDKLLSTNGMIQEFFGDETPGLSTSS